MEQSKTAISIAIWNLQMNWNSWSERKRQKKQKMHGRDTGERERKKIYLKLYTSCHRQHF